MPRRRGLEGDPCDYVAAGSWPDGELADGTPVEVVRLQQLALTLQEQVGSRSLREVAGAAGVPHSVLGAVLAGRRFPDFVTVVRLEVVLGPLWPSDG